MMTNSFLKYNYIMNYEEEILEVKHRAFKHVSDSLDKVTGINLFELVLNDKELREKGYSGDDDEEWEIEVYSILPYYIHLDSILSNGRYNITSIYKDEEGYFAHCVMENDPSQTIEMDILNGLEADTVAEIADLIMYFEEQGKI